MRVRERILKASKKTFHFKERINERDICLELVLEVVKKGSERMLLENKVRYKLNQFVVIASSNTYELITAFKYTEMTSQQQRKAGLNKRHEFGTGRSKKKSREFKRRKLKHSEY